MKNQNQMIFGVTWIKPEHMKLEYLPLGSDDCPLLRIYDFDSAGACRLKTIFSKLAAGSSEPIALHKLPDVDRIDGCELTVCVVQKDEGVISAPKPPLFECRLTQETWKQVAELTEPFCEDAQPRTHQWLDETSKISLLLSPDGQW